MSEDRGIAPDAAAIFGDSPPVRLSARPSLAGLAERAGLYRVDANSPAEDVRDALDALRAEAVAEQLDATDRAALNKLALDRLAAAGVKNARPIVRAALESKSPPTAAAPSGAAVALADPAPWPDPVDGVAALEETIAAVRRHVVVTPAQADAIALWSVMAYAIDTLSIAPILLLSSATMRSGKTSLCLVLHGLTPRALLVSSVTAPVLYRLIEAHHPTLIGDEADTWLTDERSELRGVVNAGHTRATATVARCVGEDHEVRLYSVWCARVLAMIGAPPGTIRDRAITITLRRRTADEPIERLRADRVDADFLPLRQKWRRWTNDRAAALRAADPPVPAALHDRAADCWRPLVAIADLIGGDWPDRARRAALSLSAEAGAESIGIELLTDIRALFDQRDVEVFGSTELQEALIGMSDRPWLEWSHGRPLTTARLARLLKPFGVIGGEYRISGSGGTRVVKGYRRDAFSDAWARYLPAEARQRDNPNKDGHESAQVKARQTETCRPSQSATNSTNIELCRAVAVSEGRSALLQFSEREDEDGADLRY